MAIFCVMFEIFIPSVACIHYLILSVSVNQYDSCNLMNNLFLVIRVMDLWLYGYKLYISSPCGGCWEKSLICGHGL